MRTAMTDATAKTAGSQDFDMPWVEKYRPIDVRFHVNIALCAHRRLAQLDDIVGNEETVNRLKIIAEDGNVPNIIIAVRVDAIDSSVAAQYMSGPTRNRQDNQHPVPL